MERAARRPNGAPHHPVRSVRVSDEMWAKAQRRAAYENRTMSSVMLAIVEGYAMGLIDPPQVQQIFSPPRIPQAVAPVASVPGRDEGSLSPAVGE